MTGVDGWVDFSHTFTVSYGNARSPEEFQAAVTAEKESERQRWADYLANQTATEGWREPSEDWTADLRIDKRIFIEKLRSGELECTPKRLAIANHIVNAPNCECEVCNGVPWPKVEA